MLLVGSHVHGIVFGRGEYGFMQHRALCELAVALKWGIELVDWNIVVILSTLVLFRTVCID